jgi:deoxyribodipyrimidine photolyase-related protein
MSVSVWILGDQLVREHPALLAAERMVGRDGVRVLLVESAGRASKLPYQRKKLVLLFSAMRHYAEELRVAGYQVELLRSPSALAGLQRHVADHSPTHLLTMAAAEHSGRVFQQERLARLIELPVTVLPNSQFLVGSHPLPPQANKKVILEQFYRAMRRQFNLLMDGNEPVEGAWNYDHGNRKPLPKAGLHPPQPISFAPDAITQAVMQEVAQLPNAVGAVDGFDLAVTRPQAQAAFDDFLANRLVNFGPYEDAMSSHSPVLFHSLLSPLMNIGLLDPLEMAQAAEREYRAGRAPLNSVEGFIRQIIGWREYIYWHYWRQMPALLSANAWRHTRAMPQFFWDGQTEMACLSHVVQRVIDSGYSHHIERLMLICNFCMLAGIDPAAVNRWFLTFYVDAYEWVVTPNVIGMGLNADGGQIATKPYIASANYINKMSNYCQGCRYNHSKRTGEDACPFNFLYWNFLLTHETTLRANPRFGPAVLGVTKLGAAEGAEIQRQATDFLDQLQPYR